MILLILIMKKRLISILLFIIYRNTMLYLCLVTITHLLKSIKKIINNFKN